MEQKKTQSLEEKRETRGVADLYYQYACAYPIKSVKIKKKDRKDRKNKAKEKTEGKQAIEKSAIAYGTLLTALKYIYF